MHMHASMVEVNQGHRHVRRGGGVVTTLLPDVVNITPAAWTSISSV